MRFSFDHFYFDEPASSDSYLPLLLKAMSRELNYVVPEKFRKNYKDLQDRTRQAVGWYTPGNEDDHNELLDLQDELLTALNENAPPYLTFSMNSVGSWGWQIDEWALEYADAVRVSDLSEVDDNYRGEVIVVNDHGNTTLLVRDDEGFKEIWACV